MLTLLILLVLSPIILPLAGALAMCIFSAVMGVVMIALQCLNLVIIGLTKLIS